MITAKGARLVVTRSAKFQKQYLESVDKTIKKAAGIGEASCEVSVLCPGEIGEVIKQKLVGFGYKVDLHLNNEFCEFKIFW